MKPVLSFVILTWNSEGTIIDCLKSLSKKCAQEDIQYEIYIVDNGSSDKTIDIILTDFKQLPIELIALQKNKGTSISRNIALTKCKGDIICVLDSDAIFKNGRINELISFLEDKNIGIVCPKLILPDGRTQNSAKKFPSFFSKFIKIPKIIFKLKIKDYDFYPNFPFDSETEVETAISACWFFKRELLDEVGLLDENIFYSPEDIDYCLRVRKKGKKIVYYPFVTVLHHTQHITHKKYLNRIALSHLFDLIYFFIKHRYINKPI